MAVESRLQLQPYDTTVRYYVDGTNGLDGALGTSWATAWKTLAFAQSRIEQILATNPGNLRLDLWLRGAFANEDLTLAGALAGTTTVNVIHHVDDWTVEATGTLTTISATTLKCGRREATFTGFVLDATYQGKWIVIEDGAGRRMVAQILRVSGATAWLNYGSVAAWVVGGDVLSVNVCVPSVSGIRGIRSSLCANSSIYTTGPLYTYRNLLIGLKCDFLMIQGATSTAMAVVVDGVTQNTEIDGCELVQTYIYTSQMSVDQRQEYGLIGINTADNLFLGSNFPSTTKLCTARGCDSVIWGGYFGSDPGGTANFTETISYANVPSYNPVGCFWTCSSSFSRGAVTTNHGCDSMPSSLSFVDLPAAGVPGGLLQVRKGGWCQPNTTIDGVNTGIGANLWAIGVEKGGRMQVDATFTTTLFGDDGLLHIVDGQVSFNVALSIPALVGGGADIYVESGSVSFTGNVTKSATNPSGGGIAQPVLQCRRGAKVTQAAGSSFTLPAGSGNNTTDYGANGAIDIETCCDVALGLLAGGNAVATGTAVRVKKASRLAHAGAAPTWGAAALDQGGNAAAAMPAAVTSDMAGGVPEDCWVLPGAA